MAAKKRHTTALVVLKPKASIDIEERNAQLAEATMEYLTLLNQDIEGAATGFHSRELMRRCDHALARLLAMAGFRDAAEHIVRYGG